MKRKGIVGSNTVLITVILAGVIILVLGVFTKMFFGAAETEFTEQQCRSSLLMDSFGDYVRLVCIQETKDFPIKCNRKFIDIKEEEVFNDGEIVTEKYDSSCPEGVSQESCLTHNVLAYEMADCWRLMFKGEKRILGAAEKNSWKILSTKDSLRACFVCSQISIDESANDFKKYLQNKDFVNGETYFSYIAQNDKAICDPDIEKPFERFDEKKLEGKVEPPLYENTCFEGVALGIEEGFAISFPQIHYQDILFETDWNKALNNPTFAPSFVTEEKYNGEYSVVFVRRGLGSCDVNEEESTIRDQYLTYTVQLVPSPIINKYCTTVLV